MHTHYRIADSTNIVQLHEVYHCYPPSFWLVLHMQKAISFLVPLGKVLFWTPDLKEHISLPQPREVKVQNSFLSQVQIKIKFTHEKVNVSISFQEKVEVSVPSQEEVNVKTQQ